MGTQGSPLSVYLSLCLSVCVPYVCPVPTEARGRDHPLELKLQTVGRVTKQTLFFVLFGLVFKKVFPLKPAGWKQPFLLWVAVNSPFFCF